MIFDLKREVNVMPIHEAFNIDSKGNINLAIKPRKSYMDQYDEIHKILKENKRNNNIEGMKNCLGMLFALINEIERSRDYKNRDDEAVKARSFAINDFKTYLKFVQDKDKNFDFMNFYTENLYDNKKYKTDFETIKQLKQLFKIIIM